MISNTLFALATVCLCAQLGATELSTNIAVLNAGDSSVELANAMTTVVDPSSLLASAGEPAKDGDIQEDPRDRFITTRSGKRRPMLMSDSEASEWAEDVPAAKLRKLEDGDDTGSIAGRVLSRVKRCGGGGGDDDGGNARRARRARARRANRARKAAARVKTTTVTKKVYQNGQVVSETTYAQPHVMVAPGAPMVQSVAPVVQTVAQPIQQQPVIIQQQPVAAPVVQQAPVVAPAPQVVQQQGVPSISVQGSVKVN